MNQFIKALKNNLLIIGLTFVVFFLLTFFSISFIYNNNFSYYRIDVVNEFDVEQLFSKEFFQKTISYIDEYNLHNPESKIKYAEIEYEGMLEDIKITKNDEIYSIYIKTKYFTDIAKVSNGEVANGSDRCINYIEKIFGFNKIELNYLNEEKITMDGYINPYPISLIIGVGFTFVFVICILIYTKKNKEIKITDISNNETIFKTPFSKKYWNCSKDFFKKVKNLTNISILFALLIICKLISLPSGFGALGISFTYIIFSIISMLYGPLCGIAIGALSDILGHVLFQSGSQFFFGYTVNAMIAGLTYGLCFYKTKITFTKCLLARMIVNMFVNVVLGTIWWSMVYGLNYEATMAYLYTIAIPKNIVYLLPQSIVLYIIIKAIANPLKMFNLLDEEIADNISIL